MFVAHAIQAQARPVSQAVLVFIRYRRLVPRQSVHVLLPSFRLPIISYLLRWRHPLLLPRLRVYRPAITLYSSLLPVYTKFVVSGSFDDIGGELYAPWMRYLILASILVAQIGVTVAYIIFVLQNLQALVIVLTHCMHLIDIKYFIIMQMVVCIPTPDVHSRPRK
ncbi:hypothetical protein K438DRAFT_73341 [Mycena galopus ATCC 62051]|nr:hypothetical protein K438DRAFT_73341 [Mycena galopus ATCC 62051]